MINDFFATSEIDRVKRILNTLIHEQFSCKGLLDNCFLGESRG